MLVSPAPNGPPLSVLAGKLQIGPFDPPRGEGGKRGRLPGHVMQPI